MSSLNGTPRELYTRIHALTLQVEKAKADSMAANAARTSSLVITLPDEACADRYLPSKKIIRPIDAAPAVAKVSEEFFQEGEQAIVEPPVIAQSVDSSLLKKSVTTKKKARVSPIIGVFDDPKEPLPVAGRRKFKIRLQPSEKEYKELQKPSEQNILARINLEL
jgi:hypothetical protein